MDLFPDGGFVRLRSRARGKYVHADEDEASVSLRPLGDAASLNAVWKVELQPVEGGRNLLLLLQGAAYGRYLAVVSEEDDQASSRHRGVRVLQRDYISPFLEASCVWTPHRVEAGQNYVRLHNADQRCLRVKGNLVTADARNGDETTMMQWRVEAVPQSPEPIPLPPPPPRQAPRCLGANGKQSNLLTADARNGDETTMMQRSLEDLPSTPETIPHPPPTQPPCKERCCCACGCEGSAPLCRRCAARMKTKLVANKKKLDAGKCCYCLECREVITQTHKEHKYKTIPLGRYKGEPVAWVTGEEIWSRIFERIETLNRGIKPYQLYKSDYPRCEVCSDIVSDNLLHGVLTLYCTLDCFVAGEGPEETDMERDIIATVYYGGAIGYCLTCAAAIFRGGGGTHSGHDWFSIRTSSDGSSPRVVIPEGHPKKKAWSSIKGVDAGEVLIIDNNPFRCNCGTRLRTPVNSCSLLCSLDAIMKIPVLPRPLMPLQPIRNTGRVKKLLQQKKEEPDQPGDKV